MFPCDNCMQVFTRKSNLVRHRREVHFDIMLKRYTQVHEHVDDIIDLPCIKRNGITRIVCSRAFNNLVTVIRFITKQTIFPSEFFGLALPLIQETFQYLKSKNYPTKVCCSLCVIFGKEDQRDESYFSVKTQSLDMVDIHLMIHLLQEQIDNYSKRGSNWKILTTNFFQVNVTCHQ